MTMILALNLSDQIILAADTLVSRKVGDRRQPESYYPKLQQYSNSNNTGFVSCMFAGNVRFCRYLSKQLTEAFDKEELPTQIHALRREIADFLKDRVPKYPGLDHEKSCMMIFAGVGPTDSVKTFDWKHFNSVMGPEAFRIEDPILKHALVNPLIPGLEDTTWLPIRSQLAFSFEILYPRIFGELESAATHTMICAGSYQLPEDEKRKFVKHFVSRRELASEGKDVVTYLRKHFSDSIGGAVMIGVIDNRGAMAYCAYDVDRSGPRHDSNWSIAFDNPMIAIDPDGRRVDLAAGHFDDIDEGGMEI